MKEKFDSNEYLFSDEELERIIEISPQQHKEMGFEHGWESRFDTWYKLMCELGFCYYAKDEKILISDSAKMLILAYYDKENDTFKESVWALSMDGKVGLTLGISLCVSLGFATMQKMRKYSSAIALKCLFLLTMTKKTILLKKAFGL